MSQPELGQPTDHVPEIDVRDPWDELDGLPTDSDPHPWSLTVMARNLLQTADSALLLSPGARVPATVTEVAPEDTMIAPAETASGAFETLLRGRDEPFDVVIARHRELPPELNVRLLRPGGVLLIELVDHPDRSGEVSSGSGEQTPWGLVDLQRALVQAGFSIERAGTHRPSGTPGTTRVVVIARTPESADEGRTNMRALAWDPTPAVPEV